MSEFEKAPLFGPDKDTLSDSHSHQRSASLKELLSKEGNEWI